MQFASWFNGEARIIGGESHPPSRILTTDASDSGWGAICGDDWYAGAWNKSIVLDSDIHSHCASPTSDICKSDHISVRELFPISEALDRWGESWQDCIITCETDNTQVVAAVLINWPCPCYVRYFGKL